MATKTSYRLLGEGNFIDSTGIVHERIPLNELLDKFAENVSYYQKFETVYTTTTASETIIPINITEFDETSILFVRINGLDFVEGIDYTVNYDARTITLTQALDVVGTKVQLAVLRAVLANARSFEALKGDKGQDGADGEDGVSPIVIVSQTDAGATITITDAKGTTVANITNGIDGTNGKDGEDGINGEDGISPAATITQTETGAIVTITDRDGTTTATLTNGKDGAAGIDGKDGIGIPEGGTVGQVLIKSSETDYDVQWGAPIAETTAVTINRWE